MHEPAYEPREDEYIQWDYGKGYVDALADTGLGMARTVDTSACPWCRTPFDEQFLFCPHCGKSLAPLRMYQKLVDKGLEEAEVRRLCRLATAAAGVHDGHLAVEFVSAERIAELNARHRKRANATDVLAFPIDGAPVPRGQRPHVDGTGPAGARELGDVVICPEYASDVREAIVHGVLHLVGLDHETDNGEMLALQRRVLAQVGA